MVTHASESLQEAHGEDDMRFSAKPVSSSISHFIDLRLNLKPIKVNGEITNDNTEISIESLVSFLATFFSPHCSK